MTIIEQFMQIVPAYEQIKYLTVEGETLQDFLTSFIYKHGSHVIDGKYVAPIYDLSDDFTEDQDLNSEDSLDYFRELLLDEIREDTAHGECGVDSHSNTYRIHGKLYKVTIDNVQWNRYDKQYYFIDNYNTPTITIEEIEE